MRTLIRLWIVIPALLSFAGRAAESPATPGTDGLPNFGRVNAGLYRGAQPDKLGIETLVRLGIKTIIDLRMPKEARPTEAKEAYAAGITYTNLPMRGLTRPTDEQVAKVLSLVETAPGPIFIHCKRGADRTGAIIACYRIKHDGWTGEQALKEAKQYGMSAWEFSKKKYVRDFLKSHPSK